MIYDIIIVNKMFATFYKSFKSPANIYSIDKYKDENEKTCWLIVTMKELYTLKRGDEEGLEVECKMIDDPYRASGKLPLILICIDSDNVSCKTFNLRSKPCDCSTENGGVGNQTPLSFMWVIARQQS